MRGLLRHGGPRPIDPAKMEGPSETLGPRKNEGEGVWREAETRERRGKGVRKRKAGRDKDREKTREKVERERGLRKPERDVIIHAFLPSSILYLLSTYSVPPNFPGARIQHGTKQRKFCLQEITFYKRKPDNKKVKSIEC